MSRTVLVPAHFLEELQRECSAFAVELVPYDKEGVPLENATVAEALFRWWISREAGDVLLDKYPLKWIHTGSAGVDHILTERFLNTDIILTNSAGVHAPSIAEWVVAGMLALTKDLPMMIDQQRKRIWEKVEREEMASKHVVIVGAGEIAREIALRLRPFGVRMTALRKRGESHPLFDDTKPIIELTTVIRDADWLIVAAPLTEETRRLIDTKVLAALPLTARVINVARGELLDEEALTAALQSGKLAGAILDVFSEEPLRPDHPLWGLDNVIILPHTTWRSPRVHRRQIELFVDNLRRYLQGEPLRNVVERSLGY